MGSWGQATRGCSELTKQDKTTGTYNLKTYIKLLQWTPVTRIRMFNCIVSDSFYYETPVLNYYSKYYLLFLVAWKLNISMYILSQRNISVSDLETFLQYIIKKLKLTVIRTIWKTVHFWVSASGPQIKLFTCSP